MLRGRIGVMASGLALMLLLGCSKTDPMNEPIDAPTLDEYGASMVKIAKAIPNEDDKNAFIEALEVLGIGPNAMIQRGMLTDSGLRMMEEMAKKLDGKTPREVITLADKWVEHSSLDAQTLVDEVFEPEKKRLQESEAAWRQKSGYITHGLNRLKASRQMWIERNNLAAAAIPTRDDIIDQFGEQAWPQSDFPPGAEYVFTSDGKPACILEGETITAETRSLYEWNGGQ